MGLFLEDIGLGRTRKSDISRALAEVCGEMIGRMDLLIIGERRHEKK